MALDLDHTRLSPIKTLKIRREMNISFVWVGKDDFSVSSISLEPPGSLTEKSLFLGDCGATLS